MRKKRIILAALCLLLLTSCGKQEETEEIDTGTFYASQEVWYQSDLDSIDDGCVLGETLYLFGKGVSGTSEEGTRGNMLQRLHVSGGVAEELPDFQPITLMGDVREFFFTGSLHAAADGTLVAYEPLPESSYFVRRLDQDGKELARFEINHSELLSLLDASGEEVYDLLMDADGDIYVKTSKKVGILDSTGALRFTLPVEEDRYGVDKLVLLGDGRVGVVDEPVESGGSCNRLRTVDKDSKNWSETYLLSIYSRPVDGDVNALFYYNAGEELCAHRTGAEEPEKLLNWMNTGFDGDQLRFFAPLADGRIAVMELDPDSWSKPGPLSVLAPTEEPPEKTVITYATLGMTTEERRSIVEFNRTNEQYQIMVKNYSDYSVGDTYEAALTRLTTEIGAGKIPDILAISNLPLARWAANGLLEDLWPWIDNDPELSRDQLMERVLAAAEIDGKLYEVNNSFGFNTVAGRRDIVGDRMTWTPEDMWEALEKMPEGCVPLDGTRMDLLTAMMEMDWNRFIDWEKGTCSFESEEFKAILEFCASVPEGPSPANREAWANDGRLMLYTFYPNGITSIQFGEYVLNDKLSFVGYPNPWGEVGSSFSLLGSRCMTSACKNKEGAWEYLRTLLLPHDYQDYDYIYLSGFPINKADFDAAAEKAMDKKDRDKGGMAFYSEGEYFEVRYHAVTQKEYDRIMALYNSVDTIHRADNALAEIITDVAGAYFAGDKSLEETAEQIQRRAMLYVSEQK